MKFNDGICFGLILGCIFGSFVGIRISKCVGRAECIKNHVGYYDSTTGQFRLKVSNEHMSNMPQ